MDLIPFKGAIMLTRTSPQRTVVKSESLFPVLWPWNDAESCRSSMMDSVRARSFTSFYLLATLCILIVIGLGDPRLCDTQVNALICSAAIWPTELFTAPHEFVLSWFTAPWFMHAVDQAIFCTVGFLVFTQSYECRAGTKNTIILCLGGTIIAATLVSLGLNLGHMFSPENEWINDSLARSWMGGSVAFYATIGGLAHFARTPWLMIGSTAIFEAWNHFLNGISTATSSAHMIALAFGFLMGLWLHPNGVLPTESDDDSFTELKVPHGGG
ncbi:MAG: hypothetical protein CMB77_06575 [Euryarchaeota archaeon]|nr:hypothetical protein [Euryarchaeota archaeon]